MSHPSSPVDPDAKPPPPPASSSLRLKLGAIRLPNDGCSLDEMMTPDMVASAFEPSCGKLRLRLRPAESSAPAEAAPQPDPAAPTPKPGPTQQPTGPDDRLREPPTKAAFPEPRKSHQNHPATSAPAADAAKSAAHRPSPSAQKKRTPSADAKKRLRPLFPSAPTSATAPAPVGATNPVPAVVRSTSAAAGPGAMAPPQPTRAPAAPAPPPSTARVAPPVPADSQPPPVVSLARVRVPHLPDELLKFDIQRKVGEGTYGEVYLARERKSGVSVAIKKLKVLEQMEGLPTTTLREITILHSLKALNEGKHFAALREVIMAPDYRSLHLVFEFVEHSLFGLMVQGVRFSEADLRCVFRQVLKGLTVLHESHIVHRDIKPNNILVDNTGLVKLCDFGLAFSTTAGRQRQTPRLVALAYRPPEMLLAAKTYTAAVDVWSVGCMLAQVYLGGAPPFMRNATQPADSEIEQLALVATAYGIRADHVAVLLGLSPEGVEVIQPASPLTAILSDQHLATRLERHLVAMARERKQPPIPKPVLSIICRALTLDPARRPSARELLRSGWFLNAVNEAVERAAMARRIRETVGERFCHTGRR